MNSHFDYHISRLFISNLFFLVWLSNTIFKISNWITHVFRNERIWWCRNVVVSYKNLRWVTGIINIIIKVKTYACGVHYAIHVDIFKISLRILRMLIKYNRNLNVEGFSCFLNLKFRNSQRFTKIKINHI